MAEAMTAMAYKQHLARQCGEWNKQQLALPDRHHNSPAGSREKPAFPWWSRRP